MQNRPTNTSEVLQFDKAFFHPRYFLTWLGLLLGLFISIWPLAARQCLGDIIGRYLYRNNKKRRRIVAANLRQVFPEISEAELAQKTEESLRWFGRGMVEYSVFFFGSKRRLAQQVDIVNEALLSGAKHAHEPMVLLLAHSVLLEFAAVALSMQGYSSFGSYKASKNPLLDWMIAKSRCRFVDFVVSREQGLRPLVRGIQSGHIMIFLPDQDLGLASGVYAPFFSRNKATLTTPARLSKMGKAKAVVGFVAFDRQTGRYQLRLSELPSNYPTNDLETDASAMNTALESLILQSPEQYLWAMKYYRTRPPEVPSIY